MLKACGGGGGCDFCCLCITDNNTTGAIDIGENPTPWKALTKGSGFTNKPDKNAAGSFGIGKFASFTSTYLRTVLYSTAFQNNGNLEHRFQGKTILVTHKDNNGMPLRNIGYLGDGFKPLIDQKVPDEIKLDESGTSVYIPYYRFDKIKQWLYDSTRIVLDNFFHAISHDNLQVQFKDSLLKEFPDRIIDKNTISKYQREIADNSQTQRFMRLSQRKVYKEKVFQDVGKILIRIDINPDTRWREFALVRDSGMLIISNQTSIKCKLPHLKGFPAHWAGFTAIIECKSEGKGLLRQAESPGHNCISAEYVRDTELRGYAKQQFNEIGLWCREQIRGLAELELGSEWVNADELVPYFPITGDGKPEEIDQGVPVEQGEPVVSVPEKILKAPKQYKKSRVKKKVETLVEDIVDDDTGYPVEEIELTRIKAKSKTKTKRNVKVVPQRYIGIRFMPGASSTHSVKVTFDRPDGSPTGIELSAIGEDGCRYSIGIREATFEGQPLVVKNDLIALPDTDKERQGIEIFTRDPIQDKSFDLRFVSAEQ